MNRGIQSLFSAKRGEKLAIHTRRAASRVADEFFHGERRRLIEEYRDLFPEDIQKVSQAARLRACMRTAASGLGLLVTGLAMHDQWQPMQRIREDLQNSIDDTFVQLVETDVKFEAVAEKVTAEHQAPINEYLKKQLEKQMPGIMHEARRDDLGIGDVYFCLMLSVGYYLIEEIYNAVAGIKLSLNRCGAGMWDSKRWLDRQQGSLRDNLGEAIRLRDNYNREALRNRFQGN